MENMPEIIQNLIKDNAWYSPGLLIFFVFHKRFRKLMKRFPDILDVLQLRLTIFNVFSSFVRACKDKDITKKKAKEVQASTLKVADKAMSTFLNQKGRFHS